MKSFWDTKGGMALAALFVVILAIILGMLIEHFGWDKCPTGKTCDDDFGYYFLMGED